MPKVYVSAVYYHEWFGERKFSNQLFKYTISCVPQWDLPFVLKQAVQAHWADTFKTIVHQKTGFLLALTSAQRVNNVCTLSVHLSCSAYQNLSRTILAQNSFFTQEH